MYQALKEVMIFYLLSILKTSYTKSLYFESMNQSYSILTDIKIVHRVSNMSAYNMTVL